MLNCKMSVNQYQVWLTLILCAYKLILHLCASFDGRSYVAAADGQVHENPEWEKARQALASISKSQNSKTAQANRTTVEVCFILSTSMFYLALKMTLGDPVVTRVVDTWPGSSMG